MCRQELPAVVLSLNSSSMKPYGDILPWSSIDRFPWHVSTSSLQQLLSADLISLWDLTGWDAWRPTAASDPYLLELLPVLQTLSAWFTVFQRVREAFLKDSNIEIWILITFWCKFAQRVNSLCCPVSRFLREFSLLCSVCFTRWLKGLIVPRVKEARQRGRHGRPKNSCHFDLSLQEEQVLLITLMRVLLECPRKSWQWDNEAAWTIAGPWNPCYIKTKLFAWLDK